MTNKGNKVNNNILNVDNIDYLLLSKEEKEKVYRINNFLKVFSEIIVENKDILETQKVS